VARRSRVEGVTQLRRQLRRVDPAVTLEIRGTLLQALSAIAATERALMPADTGAMRDSIQLQISRDGLTGIVGPAARAAEIVRRKTGSEFGRIIAKGKRKGQKFTLRKANKKLLMQFYKAYWLNYGTKGTPRRNILPQSALHFVEAAWQANQNRLHSNMTGAVNRALVRISHG